MSKVYLHKLAITLIIVGAINWGLVAVNINLVTIINDYINNLVGYKTNIDKIIYVIIAFAAIKVMKRDTFLPFLGKTIMPTSVIPLKKNKYQNDTVKIHVQPNSKVIYWAAKKLDSNNHSVWKAYDDYSNSGVVMSDKNGVAILKLQKGSGYMVPWGGGKYVPPHVHYRYEIKPSKFSRLETVYY